MSRYEWERGEIKIPCQQWKEFFGKIQEAAGGSLISRDDGVLYSVLVDDGGGCITLYPKTRTVVWDVDENNHACETAREDPIARAFFRALEKINWVRGTGGEIVGNDEYNRDSDRAGDGGNYVKNYYGPPRKRIMKYRS